jgi:hypothetical protein
MKEPKIQTEQMKKTAFAIIASLTKHRFVLIFVILGAAISFALLRTQNYIDIPRNETRYNEGVLTINYKEIDTETIKSFQEKIDDGNVSVDSQYDPDRDNPFIE